MTLEQLPSYIDSLKNKIDELESCNNTLKDRINWLEEMLREKIQEENEEDWEDYDE